MKSDGEHRLGSRGNQRHGQTAHPIIAPSKSDYRAIAETEDAVVVNARSGVCASRCPPCGSPSRRVHSRYVRQIADFPCGGRRVHLCIVARRFFCDAPLCRRRFHAMVRARSGAELEQWITDASASLIASFARGVARDKAAVCAAITEPWSNGQTEGQITKLKLVRRQMYGKGKLDLLQVRLIGAA